MCTKNSILMKIPLRSLFPEQVTNIFPYYSSVRVVFFVIRVACSYTINFGMLALYLYSVWLLNEVKIFWSDVPVFNMDV